MIFDHLRRLAAALAIVLPGLATAQSASAPSPVIWSGPYLGATLGFGGADLVGPGGSAASQDGRETSIYTGFSWVRGQYLFGVEYDLTVNIGRDYVFGDRVPIGSTTAAIDWLSSFRGRFGFIQNDTLVYATAGLNYSDTVSQGRSYDIGYVMGGGLERMFASRRWTWRAEVLFHEFSPDANPTRAQVDEAWLVRFGVARYF